jgi:hypothetical protein
VFNPMSTLGEAEANVNNQLLVADISDPTSLKLFLSDIASPTFSRLNTYTT